MFQQPTQSTSVFQAIVQGLSVAAPVIAGLNQIITSGRRAKIKADLSLLKKSRALFGPEDPRSKAIEAKVSEFIDDLYRGSSLKARVLPSVGYILLGLTCLAGVWAFGFHSAYEPWKRYGIAGILAFIALGSFADAFDPKLREDHPGPPPAAKPSPFAGEQNRP
jgi:hypothetical protein